jgi:hypothetical protein
VKVRYLGKTKQQPVKGTVAMTKILILLLIHHFQTNVNADKNAFGTRTEQNVN